MSKVLHQLVHSLDKKEKRSFRISNSLKKNSINLFNALDSIKVFDNKKLKKSIDRNIQNNLSYEKHNLQQLILDFLYEYHQLSSVRIEVTALIVKVKILLHKNQLELADRLAEKAIKLAEPLELYDLLYSLYEYKVIFLLLRSGPKSFKNWKGYLEKMRFVADKIQEESRFYDLNGRFLIGQHSYINRDPEFAKKEMEGFINGPLMLGEVEATTFNSKRYLLKAKKSYARLIGDYEGATECAGKIYSLFKDNRKFININLINYIYDCFGYIQDLNNTNNFALSENIFKEIEKWFEKAKADKLLNEGEILIYNYQHVFSKLHYYVVAHKYDKVIDLHNEKIEEIESFFEEKSMVIWTYNYAIILSYFSIQSYKDAITRLSVLEKEIDIHQKPNYYFPMKAYAIIASCKIGDEELFKSNYNALVYYSRKNKIIKIPYYNLILKFLRKLENGINKSLDRKSLKNILLQLKEVEIEKYTSGEFLIQCIISEIENKSILEIVSNPKYLENYR